MIKIGDIVRKVPNIEGHQYLSPMPCRVVYIHPDEVFYTAEFINADRNKTAYW